MEEIVDNNQSLVWDGWDVVHLKQSDRGATAPNGIRIKGKWYVKTTYTPNRDGWTMPDRLIKNNEQR